MLFQEEGLRKGGEPKYAHLSMELHVFIEVFAPVPEAYLRMAHAMEEVKKFLFPVSLTLMFPGCSCLVCRPAGEYLLTCLWVFPELPPTIIVLPLINLFIKYSIHHLVCKMSTTLTNTPHKLIEAEVMSFPRKKHTILRHKSKQIFTKTATAHF